MNLDAFFILGGFLVALAYPVAYSFGPWYRYPAGRSAMNLSVVIALALGLAVARQFLGDDYAHRETVRTVVYGLIFASLSTQLAVLLYVRNRPPVNLCELDDRDEREKV